MRYIVSDERPIGLEDIRTVFAEASTGYEVDGEEAEATIAYKSRTLDRLVPLWTWLQANRRGLIQADGEGYYDGQELIMVLG